MLRPLLNRPKTSVSKALLPPVDPVKRIHSKRRLKTIKKTSKPNIPKLNTAISEQAFLHNPSSRGKSDRQFPASSRQRAVKAYFNERDEDVRDVSRVSIYAPSLSESESSSDMQIMTDNLPDIDNYRDPKECCETKDRNKDLKDGQEGDLEKLRGISIVLRTKEAVHSKPKDIAVEESEGPPATSVKVFISPDNCCTPNLQHPHPLQAPARSRRPIHSRGYQFSKFLPNIKQSSRSFQTKQKSTPTLPKPRVVGNSESPRVPGRSKLSEQLDSKSFKYFKVFRHLTPISIRSIANPVIAQLLKVELPDNTPEASINIGKRGVA
jgi:hypothetical protein